MSSVTLQSNKQIDGGTNGQSGGGGLYLVYKVTANIRECTFIRNEATTGSTGNKHGHQVFTNKGSSGTPSIAIVNTNFTDVSGSHAFYGYDGSGGADKYVSPTTCAPTHCTVTPFIGCYPKPNENEGTFCTTTCQPGTFTNPTQTACTPCTAGTYNPNQGATNATQCLPCPAKIQ